MLIVPPRLPPLEQQVYPRREVVQVPDGARSMRGPSRDAGKCFLITEWPAAVAERWAVRALLAYNRGGGDVNVERALGLGMEAVFWVGIQTFLRGQMQADEVIPILDQLLECVKIIRDPQSRDRATGELVAQDLILTGGYEDDIKEIQTRFWLRSEVLRVHTGFSAQDAASTFLEAMFTRRPGDLETPSTSQS